MLYSYFVERVGSAGADAQDISLAENEDDFQASIASSSADDQILVRRANLDNVFKDFSHSSSLGDLLTKTHR